MRAECFRNWNCRLQLALLPTTVQFGSELVTLFKQVRMLPAPAIRIRRQTEKSGNRFAEHELISRIMFMITRTLILDYMQQTTTHYCNLYGSQLHVIVLTNCMNKPTWAVTQNWHQYFKLKHARSIALRHSIPKYGAIRTRNAELQHNLHNNVIDATIESVR